MIFIYTIEDTKSLKGKIREEYLEEVKNTFISYYDSLGWDTELTSFSLVEYGPIVIFENQREFKNWIEIYKKTFSVEEWILRTCIIYKIDMKIGRLCYTLFLNKSHCINPYIKTLINKKVRYVKKYTGTKLRLKE